MQRKLKTRKYEERATEGAEEALDEEIQRTLAQARELVRREHDHTTAESCTARDCFPRVPRDDPRASRMEELKRARRKLMKKSRFDKCVRQEIRQIEEQARRLLIEGTCEADGPVR